MAKYIRHMFICAHRRPEEARKPCCAARNSEALLKKLKVEVARAGLKGRIRVNESKCLDQCQLGCVAVVYPEATWYGGLTPDDFPGLLKHLVAGEVYQAKVLKDEEINPRPPSG